jgi:hypothetical protein
MSSFGFIKMYLEKWRNVLDGVLGGYCRGMVVVRSTCRVLPKEMEMVMCDLPGVIKEGGHV